jgi:hypothetical protein
MNIRRAAVHPIPHSHALPYSQHYRQSTYCNRYLETAFSRKHWLLKQKKSLTSLSLFCNCVLCFQQVSLQPPWNSRTSRAEVTPQGKDQQSLSGQTTSQMRTITYNDEAATWSKGDHLTGTRLGILKWWSTRTHVAQDCLTLSTPPQFFLYSNLKLLSVPWRWAEVLSLPPRMVCLCYLINLFLHPPLLLLTFFAKMGKWPDSTYGTPGIVLVA